MQSFMMLLGEKVLPATSINRTVGVIVWVGVIVFTLAFFVLSWTKLGRAKPLVKCLTLSVFAHILLAIFFYGTQMLGLEMQLGGDMPVTISLISEPAGDLESSVNHRPQDTIPELGEAFPQAEPMDSRLLEIEPTVVDLEENVGVEEIAKQQAAANETEQFQQEELPSEANPPLERQQPMESSVEIEDETVEAATGPDVAVDTASAVDAIQQAETADAVSDEALDSQPMEEVIPRRLDGVELPEAYQARFRSVASEQVRGAAFGATLETEAAVKAGLQWLAASQKADGQWDASELGAGVDRAVDGQNRGATGANADTGISGLALLAFMGHGQTHLKGEHRLIVQRGLEYLLAQQRKDGNLSGHASLFAKMYCHAMATIAVCEAFAMTGDQRLGEYAERAVGFTIRSQDPKTGGWRYQPADAGDMSQFGWQVLALQSAQEAGVMVPSRTKELMVKFLATCNAGAKGGLAAYRPGFGATRTMTAESLACRMWLDTQRSVEQVKEASDFIIMQLPSQTRPDLYYWYYGSLSLRQVGGPAWQTWTNSMKQVVPSLQLPDGSWTADTKWGGYGGRVYSTAMAVLCLESFYRYQ